MGGPLAFLDTLPRRPALVVEPHDGAIGEREIHHDEADALKQLAFVVLRVMETVKVAEAYVRK